MIWVYLVLLLFEGALRKWILPGLSGPLLVVRDPIALIIIVSVISKGIWTPNKYVLIIWFVTALAFISALVIGHGNLTVAVYGLRITLLHFPLIFIIGRVLDKSDVINIGIFFIWVNIGMTLLVAVQFYSPQSAFVNRGVGGDLEGSGFSGAAGFFRVPGTFSFTNGLSLFYGLAAAFIVYFWLTPNRKKNNRFLLATSTLCLLAAIPLSISRTVLFSILVSVAFSVPILLHLPKLMSRMITIALVTSLSLVVLSNFSFFQTATMAFSQRFSNASQSEGGFEGVFIDRFLGGMISAITDQNASITGLGLGMGTNVGAQLLSGNRKFLIAEGEWARLIGEMGIILGLAVILVRFTLIIRLFLKSWKLVNAGNILPWILMSFASLTLLQGQWAQPTALGFAVLSGGFVIASIKS